MSEINNISNNMKLPTINNNSKAPTTTNKENNIQQLNQLNDQIEEINLDAPSSQNTNNSNIKELSSSNEISLIEEYGVELLEGEGIYGIKEEVIESVISKDDEYEVKLKTGEKFCFETNDNGEISLSYIRLISGELVAWEKLGTAELTEYQEESLREENISLDNGYLKILGTDIRIFKYDNINFTEYLKEADAIAKTIESSPKEIKKTLENKRCLKGFLVRKGDDIGENYIWQRGFIEIVRSENILIDLELELLNLKKEIVASEIGSLLDRYLEDKHYEDITGERKISDEWYDFLPDYEDELRSITPGIEEKNLDSEELFDMAIRAYILRNDKLEEKAPVLYSSIHDLLCYDKHGNESY